MFEAVKGETGGVYTSENNLLVQWTGGGRIIFSYSKRGGSINAHFSSDKEGLRSIKRAINDFCLWAFNKYSWCIMVLAMVKKESVSRLISKCGFNHLIDIDLPWRRILDIFHNSLVRALLHAQTRLD